MTTLQTLRRRAAEQGYGIRKVPERARVFAEYGPYLVFDLSHNTVVAHGLDLDRLAAWVARQSEDDDA